MINNNWEKLYNKSFTQLVNLNCRGSWYLTPLIGLCHWLVQDSKCGRTIWTYKIVDSAVCYNASPLLIHENMWLNTNILKMHRIFCHPWNILMCPSNVRDTTKHSIIVSLKIILLLYCYICHRWVFSANCCSKSHLTCHISWNLTIIRVSDLGFCTLSPLCFTYEFIWDWEVC